jgi:hypothetical protein
MMVKKKKTFLNKLWDNIVDVFSSEKIIPFKPKKDKCGYCGVVNAKWKNTVVLDYACDDCVPRGCSCNLYKKNKKRSFVIEEFGDYEYKTDKEGRELPCEDWERIKQNH